MGQQHDPAPRGAPTAARDAAKSTPAAGDLRDRMLASIDECLPQNTAVDGETRLDSLVKATLVLERLASGADALDRIAHRATGVPDDRPPQMPGDQRARLLGQIWQATQEAGASTEIGDKTLEALTKTGVLP